MQIKKLMGVGKTRGQSRSRACWEQKESRECWEQKETVSVGQGDAAEEGELTKMNYVGNSPWELV